MADDRQILALQSRVIALTLLVEHLLTEVLVEVDKEGDLARLIIDEARQKEATVRVDAGDRDLARDMMDEVIAVLDRSVRRSSSRLRSQKESRRTVVQPQQAAESPRLTLRSEQASDPDDPSRARD